MPTIRLTDAASDEALIINVYSEQCTTTPMPPECVDSEAAAVVGDDVELTVALNAGTEYCVIGISSRASGSVAQYTFLDGNPSCGLLPVELQNFTIDEAGAEDSKKSIGH